MLYTPSKHARSSWIHVGSMKIMNSETPPVEVSPDVETSNGYLRGNSSNATILPFPLARGNGRIPWNPGSIMSLCDECRPWVVPVAPKRVRNRWNTSSPENYWCVCHYGPWFNQKWALNYQETSLVLETSYLDVFHVSLQSWIFWRKTKQVGLTTYVQDSWRYMPYPTIFVYVVL